MQDNLNQRDTTATTNSVPDLSRRRLLKAGAATGGLLAISGCASADVAQADDETPDADEPTPAESGDPIRTPQLHLDTLEAAVEGETLQAVSYDEWRSGSTTYVGQVSARRSADLFVGVSLPGDDTEQFEHEKDAELVVYLCDGEIGAVPEIAIYLTGDYDTSGVTLTNQDVPSADEDIEVKLALVDGTFLGAVTMPDREQLPFIAAETTGDAGLYKADPDDRDLLIQWVVLPDGRQRGFSLDGKGNDVYPPPGVWQ